MNMNKEQIGMAVQAGLELLGPESGVVIPVKLNDGVFFLKGLLVGIAQGKISLSSVEQGKQSPPATPPPATKTKPNRRARRVSKKITKKAAKKAVKTVAARRKEARKKK
jgi:hypothetical protein